MKIRLAAVVALLTLPLLARADVAPAPPMWVRVATVDMVLVGRVMGLEDKDVQVQYSPDGDKITFRIAQVTVSESIKDAGKLKTVRVGFVVPPPNAPKLGRPNFSLKVGQEGLLFLRKHPQADFYQVDGFYGYVDSATPGDYYKDILTQARRMGKLLADAPAGLKAKDAEERFLTAALLIAKYRHVRPFGGKTRQEPIDAEESKLILLALHDADWTKPTQFGQAGPLLVFHQLQVTAAEGWMAPAGLKDPQEYTDAVRAWLKKNAETYRIKRIVADTNK